MRRHLGDGSDGHDDVARRQVVLGGVVPDADRAAAVIVRVAAVDHGAGLGQARRVPAVVRFGGTRRPVDHVVARGGGGRPLVGGRVGVVPCGAVEEGLGRQAADVRAARHRTTADR